VESENRSYEPDGNAEVGPVVISGNRRMRWLGHVFGLGAGVRRGFEDEALVLRGEAKM